MSSVSYIAENLSEVSEEISPSEKLSFGVTVHSEQSRRNDNLD